MFWKHWTPIERLIWLYRTVINAVPAVLKTVTGNPIHITDALAKAAEELSVAFAPVQDLHGYSSPWPPGGGKNLLDCSSNNLVQEDIAFNTSTTNVRTVGYIPITPSTTYYISQTEGFAGRYLRFYDANKEHLSSDNINQYGSSARAASFTSPASAAYMLVMWYRSSGLTVQDVQDVLPQIELGSSPTAYAPYSNECPISGWSSISAYVSPTQDAQDASIYTIDLDGTRYVGTLDVPSGVLTVTSAFKTYTGASSEAWKYEATQGGNFYIFVQDASTPQYARNSSIISNMFPVSPANGTRKDTCFISNSRNLNVTIGATLGIDNVADWKTYLASYPLQLCYELATPIEIQLTPTQVQLLLGENYVWSDSNNDLTLTYYADGNADDAEALNLLLGNRYVNNHEPDEPSDREALDILLGRDSR